MQVAMRLAGADDLDRLVAIKESLAVEPGQATGPGFLLGCDASRYAALIAADRVWVLEEAADVQGFAVTLSDPLLRGSTLWARRADITWTGLDPSEIEAERIGYFDQLAMAHTFQKKHLGAALSLRAIEGLFGEGHAHVFATTLVSPVLNHAALPLLRRIGARAVGAVRETYPEIGTVVSSLHHVDRATYERSLRALMRGGVTWEQAVIRDTLGARRGEGES